MIRALLGDRLYWNKAVVNGFRSMEMAKEEILQPPGDPNYRAEYVWGYTLDHPRQTLTQYSRGDPIYELYQPFPTVLDAWELSNREATAICLRENLPTCRDWTFDLHDLEHYQWCMWLIALAILLEIDQGQWLRLLTLIGGEGEDAVLDGLIATRTPERTQGNKVLHKKPYARLWVAMQTQSSLQAQALREFVEQWYVELKRPGKKAIWWYEYGNPEINPLKKGSYFGRWCLEAAATAKALKIDDTLCMGHENYPGDFLHPNGHSTHLNHHGVMAWLKNKFTGKGI